MSARASGPMTRTGQGAICTRCWVTLPVISPPSGGVAWRSDHDHIHAQLAGEVSDPLCRLWSEVVDEFEHRIQAVAGELRDPPGHSVADVVFCVWRAGHTGDGLLHDVGGDEHPSPPPASALANGSARSASSDPSVAHRIVVNIMRLLVFIAGCGVQPRSARRALRMTARSITS
jgi:hypothetical protein